MVRYTRQYNEYTCGPVAIINALKWSGHKATLKQDLKLFAQECRCEPCNGTSHGNFDRVLRAKSNGRFTVRRRVCPNLADIEQHLLRPKCAVIINFLRVDENEKELDAHYALLTGITESEKFMQINSFNGKTVEMATKQQLLRDLEKRKGKNGKIYPRAWFLTKRI